MGWLLVGFPAVALGLPWAIAAGATAGRASWG
jgi:hypothetical protein